MRSHSTATLFPVGESSYKEVLVKADKADLYCRVIGIGDPLIVVHGGPGLTMDYLLPGLAELTKNHMVIFYDQRGNGKSSGDIYHESMNLEKFTDDLLAIQNHFRLQKVDLLGHSWGAYLAMNYASSHPDRINKLYLLNSIPLYTAANSSDAEPQQIDPYEAMIASIIKSDSFKDDNAKELIQIYKNLFQYFFYDASLVDKLNLESMSANQVKRSALIHKIFEENFFHQPHDIRDKLANLKNIPTLIIHGDGHDIPVSVAEEIHALIDNSTLTILNSGHFPYIEKPQELFESLAWFHQGHVVNMTCQ